MSKKQEGSAHDYGFDDMMIAGNGFQGQHPNMHRPKRTIRGASAGHVGSGSAVKPHVHHMAVHKQHNATVEGNRKQKIS